jgi:hypothetical protein
MCWRPLRNRQSKYSPQALSTSSPSCAYNNNKIHWTSMCRIGVIKQPCAYCHARPALKRIQVQIAGNGETPIVLSCFKRHRLWSFPRITFTNWRQRHESDRSELRWRASLLSSSNKSSSRRMPAWIHDAWSGARRASEHSSRETKQITWRETRRIAREEQKQKQITSWSYK